MASLSWAGELCEGECYLPMCDISCMLIVCLLPNCVFSYCLQFLSLHVLPSPIHSTSIMASRLAYSAQEQTGEHNDQQPTFCSCSC